MVPAIWRRCTIVGVVLALCAASAVAQTPDLQVVARNLVQSAMVGAGDKVLVVGSVPDATLLENVAIETVKAGGQVLIALGSEQLARRSYDEVPAAYDTMERTLNLALINTFDAQISIDIGETEDFLAGVPQARLTARAKSFQAANDGFLKRGVRLVNLGNGLYPTATLSRRLGIAQSELADTFWKAAGVPADTLRARGEALRDTLAKAKVVTLTHPGGTSLSFGLDPGRGFVSDGVSTPEKRRQGGAAAQTWLPAGELVIPVAPGTAEGKVVIDKVLWRGKEIRGLTLTYSKGRLTSMTAAVRSACSREGRPYQKSDLHRRAPRRCGVCVSRKPLLAG